MRAKSDFLSYVFSFSTISTGRFFKPVFTSPPKNSLPSTIIFFTSLPLILILPSSHCLEEFEKQRLVVANPFSYNKRTRTGIVAEFDNGYHLSKEVGIKRNFITIGMRVWDIIRKNRYAVIISFIGYIAENIKFNSNVIYISHDLIKGYGLVKPNYRDYYNAIAYLEDENIIKRTNIRNIYVVNPIYIFRGDVNKLINIISEAKLIKTFDDKDRLIVDKFVLFKNDTDKGIVIANKDLYATEVVDINED